MMTFITVPDIVQPCEGLKADVRMGNDFLWSLCQWILDSCGLVGAAASLNLEELGDSTMIL
jgi:hypothetical protein